MYTAQNFRQKFYSPDSQEYWARSFTFTFDYLPDLGSVKITLEPWQAENKIMCCFVPIHNVPHLS